MLWAGDGRGYTEVGHLHLAVAGDENVAGLDITVDEAVAVGEPEGGGDIGRYVGGPVGMERAVGADDLGQAPTLDVLHDDEVGALLLAPVVDADDVRVVQVGGRLGLPSESLHEAGIVGELVEEDLDGHRAIQEEVARQVDVGHAASGDLPVKFVPAVENGRPLCGHGCGFYRRTPGR